MAAGQPEGNIRGGDQPRMTESQLKTEDKGMGRITYTRQAQRGNMPKSSYGRYTRK
jgi:hypothetical protein